MAAAVKFQDFAEQLGKAVHNLATGALKIMLSNTAPSATNTVKADITEITAGNGYSAGGTALPSQSYTETGGTGTLTANKVTFTASGGSIGPFRYAVLYNDTPTSPADPLIQYWDYGSGVTITDGNSFDVKFSNQDTAGTVLTLA